jgi:nitrogen regulatory protein PII
MKLIIAYIRMHRAADVMRELYKAGVGGLTAYEVRGMSGEKSTVFYSKRPFEIHHLPESVKLEIICPEESIDGIVKILAQTARTGDPGDGIIVMQDVEKVLRIRDIEPLS